MAKNINYFVKRVKSNTCVGFYPNSESFKNGINYEVEYADTFREEFQTSETSRQHKTILCLHGAPGNFENFHHQLNVLPSMGNFRILAPNFPDYSLTIKTRGLFKHSANERASILVDFLKAIGVNHLDSVISYSASSYPTINLIAGDNGINIKSVILLSPATTIIGPNEPPRFVTAIIHIPYTFFYDRQWFRSLLEPFGKLIMSTFPHGLFKTIDEALLAFGQRFETDMKEITENIGKIRGTLPIMIIFGSNDELIPEPVFREYVKLFGADSKDHFQYIDIEDKEPTVDFNGRLPKVVVIKRGKHNTTLKRPNLVNTGLIQLLSKL